MQKKRKTNYIRLFFRSTSLLFNIAAIMWLAICLFASFKSTAGAPSVLSLWSFTSFFAVLANVFFVVFWLFSSKKYLSLLSLVTLLFCYPISRSVMGYNLFSGNTISKDDVQLKIMTWNVHLFDLGEWTKDKASKNKIVDFIKEQNPDILCLQEFYHDSADIAEPYTQTLQELGYTYYEFAKEEGLLKRSINISAQKEEIIFCGNAIFSKYPLSNKTRYAIDENKYYNMLSVDVDLGNSNQFRLNVLHLQSVAFSDKEVVYAEQKADKIPTKLEDKSKGLLKKLMLASSKRAAQAEVIDSIFEKSTLPNMVCGDFNDIPGSFVYRKIKGNLKDAFVSKGLGLGRTYRKIFATLRIDYIFYDDNILNCRGYSSPDINLSDHNPVMATFTVKKDTNQK